MDKDEIKIARAIDGISDWIKDAKKDFYKRRLRAFKAHKEKINQREMKKILNKTSQEFIHHIGA